MNHLARLPESDWRKAAGSGKGGRMADRPKPRAAGAFLALSIIVGSVVGGLYQQPSLGFLTGLAVGVAVALGVWAAGRK